MPDDELKRIDRYLHYPECWDTAAYPTLYHAVVEVTPVPYCTTCRGRLGA